MGRVGGGEEGATKGMKEKLRLHERGKSSWILPRLFFFFGDEKNRRAHRRTCEFTQTVHVYVFPLLVFSKSRFSCPYFRIFSLLVASFDTIHMNAILISTVPDYEAILI